MEIQKTTLTPSMIGSIANSLQTEKRIVEAEAQEIKQAIAYGVIAMGLRNENLPNDLEKAFLLEWIKKNLPRYTLTEFKAAFDLAAAKKIKVEHHYQKFSAAYLGQLMKAYEEQYRVKVVEHMNKIQSQAQQEEPPTPSERKKIREAFVLTCIMKPIKAFKSGKSKELVFPCSLQKVYSYLLSAELSNLTFDDRISIKNKNRRKLKKHLNQMIESKAQTPQQHQQKKEARELLKEENALAFEKKLNNLCRLESITLICEQNEIKTIQEKLLK